MTPERTLRTAFFAGFARELLPRIHAARKAAVGALSDCEALHDYRVLVRRLIEATRTWTPRALRRPLLQLGRPWVNTTNSARDSQVEGALIDTLLDQVHPNQRAGLERFAARHKATLRRLQSRARHYLTGQDRDREERLFADLLKDQPRSSGRPRRWPKQLRKKIHAMNAALKAHGDDPRILHRLRLSVKRLRYSLEPLARLDKSIAPALEELTALQRALGDHRDWQRLGEKLAAARPKIDSDIPELAFQHSRESLKSLPAALPKTNRIMKRSDKTRRAERK